MDPDGKKISFGFNKLTKKPTIISRKYSEEKKVELIDSIEGKSIKIKDAIEEIDRPRVIPLNDSKKNLLDSGTETMSRQKVPITKNAKEETDNRPDSELTLDELATKALIREAKDHAVKKENKVLEVPLNEDANTLIIDRANESTIEDYESVPISDFGLAMLRGMGWQDGMGIGKTASKLTKTSMPELRPKGLGLGANRIIAAEKPKEEIDKDGKELILVKGAFGKIIAGPHRGHYCEVQGFDDEAGRVIVKTALKGEILTLNEFLVFPVTKEEFSKSSKILNYAKYEDYKEISEKKIESYRKNEVENFHINTRIKDSDKNKDSEIPKSSKGYSSNEDFYTEKRRDKYRERQEHQDNSFSSNDDKYKKEVTSSNSKGKVSKIHRRKTLRDKSSSDSDFHDREKKNNKSNRRNRSRSQSQEKSYRISKKKSKSCHRSRSRTPSVGKHKRKSKKNKCKSRHRRSSSSESEREYRRNQTKTKR